MNPVYFICPAGHCEQLPYPEAPVTAWCVECRKPVQFSPVPPPSQETPEQQESSGRSIGEHIKRRFQEFADTIDRRKCNETVALVADPKTEAQKALVRQLRTGGFPERHIASLPRMDAAGMALARQADDALCAHSGPVTCILWGDYGNGKTQVAAGVALLRAQRGERTRYMVASDFIRTIKDGFASKVPESVVLRKFYEAPGLILDDIHAALDDDPGAVKWARGQFQNLLDFRYRSNLPLKTVLVANAPDSAALNYRLGAQILSRVSEDGKLIHVNSRNYRKP